MFAFTGEETDVTTWINLRNRYYNPALGVFPSLDPLEGASCTPMSLNRYMYVQGNVTNATDPSGMICSQQLQQACNCFDYLNHFTQNGFPDVAGFLKCLKNCTLSNTVTPTQGSTSSSNCQSNIPSWQNSVVKLAIPYLGEQGYEVSLGTYVDLGNNCILTHSHWEFQLGKSVPQKLIVIGLNKINNATVDWSNVQHPDTSVGKGQTLFCLGNQAPMGITNPPLTALPIASDASNILSNCSGGYGAYLVHHDPNAAYNPSLVNITITKPIQNFKGFVTIDDGFELASNQSLEHGDSGLPILANGQIPRDICWW